MRSIAESRSWSIVPVGWHIAWDNGLMEKSYAQHYALLEGEHWWFRARRVILRDLLARLKWPQRPRILEIGVGPGYSLLEVYPPDACLEGVEPDQGLARLAAKRGPAAVFQAPIDQLPPE